MGGSIGIAVVETMQARFSQKHINYLGAHVTPFDTQANQMLSALTSRLGERPALASMWGLVQAQAAMLSFIDVFRILAVMFLVLVPLLLIMKRPAKGAAAEIAH
jgi:DHA2 family multidrug resistance protein